MLRKERDTKASTPTIDRRQAINLFAAGSLAAFSSPALARKQTKSPVDGFDALLEEARLGWRAPGLAVAVVKDGVLIYAKGFGWGDSARTQAINADTLFGTASLTKAFTSASVACLVDDGKLDWDEPVKTYLKGFEAAGGSAYSGITLRDMLSHRTGLPRHDLIWYNNAAMTKDDLLARLPYLPMSRPLRSAYQYNNIMYILAGLAVERVSGQSWETFTRARILDPLGMTRTQFSPNDMQRAGNFAFGHRSNGTAPAIQLALRPEDAIGPAGEISSTVNDYIKWIGLHLGQGRFGTQQILSKAAHTALFEPLISTGGQPDAPELSRGFYGLGWRMDTYRGMQRIAHGGNLNGFSSRVTLFPAQKIGMIAFANLRGTPLPGHVSLDMMDALMGLEPVHWSNRGLARRNAAEAAPKVQGAPAPIPGTNPSRDLAAFTGAYFDPGYGAIAIQKDDGGLRGTYNNMPFRLAHWHYDVFNALPLRDDDDDLLNIKFDFNSNMMGQIDTVAVAMEADTPPILFQRV